MGKKKEADKSNIIIRENVPFTSPPPTRSSRFAFQAPTNPENCPPPAPRRFQEIEEAGFDPEQAARLYSGGTKQEPDAGKTRPHQPSGQTFSLAELRRLYAPH